MAARLEWCPECGYVAPRGMKGVHAPDCPVGGPADPSRVRPDDAAQEGLDAFRGDGT